MLAQQTDLVKSSRSCWDDTSFSACSLAILFITLAFSNSLVPLLIVDLDNILSPAIFSKQRESMEKSFITAKLTFLYLNSGQMPRMMVNNEYSNECSTFNGITYAVLYVKIISQLFFSTSDQM